MPSISIRKSIRWRDGPAGENTSTLVLTSRAKNYVDVRVYKPAEDDDLPKDPRDSRAITQLEWAFAGQSVNTPAEYDGGELKKPSHTIWSHWVDSKTLDEVKDEGYMWPQADGTILEKGAMAHPNTGLTTNYEEIWEDLEGEATGNEEQRISYVLILDEPSKKARGMVIRVGGYVQGVMRIGDVITAIRWQWVPLKESLVFGNYSELLTAVMPWLSRQNSIDEVVVHALDEAAVIHKTVKKKSVVTFIPAQIDGLCGTTPSNQKSTPSKLVWEDIRTLIQNVAFVPPMTRSIFTKKMMRSCFSTSADLRDAALQCGLAVAHILMLTLGLPAFLLLPGFMILICAALASGITFAMAWPLNGSRVVRSDRKYAPMTEDFSDERWIYVNGMMCSHQSLRAQCDRLSKIFSRPITGVHNQTSGIILDSILALLQRSLALPTPCTRTLTSQLRVACLNNTVRKVIILGHGTGGLHISQALDTLHADLPIEVLSKLEIYTFGSAASHLSNPCLRIDALSKTHCSVTGNQAKFTRPDGSIASPVKATLASLGHRVEDHERVIPHVEHYALSSDLVARWGVLHHVKNVLDNRFCGRVFVLDDTKTARGGFLMNDHYLDTLFPTDANRTAEVLDQVVDVDVETAEKREFTAQGIALPLKTFGGMMGTSPPLSPDHLSPKSRKEKRGSWGTAGAMGVDGVAKARNGARESEGRTLRQLSRLWRFAGGGRPVGEGVAVVNGVGNAGSGIQGRQNKNHQVNGH